MAERASAQGAPEQLLHSLRRAVTDDHTSTMRAKKAVACLLFVSGKPMTEIEANLTQFGGAFGGAAGPVRSVAARTSDRSLSRRVLPRFCTPRSIWANA